MEHHGPPLWISSIPVLSDLPIHVAHSLLVFILLISVFVLARPRLMHLLKTKDYIPSPKVGFFSVLDYACESLLSLCQSVLGKEEGIRFFPFIASLFFYIFTSNFLGLLPGFLPPTDNYNTTLALGVFVFLYYNFIGIKEHGLGYLKHFTGPVLAFAPLMFVIEIISHLVRPVSLAFRLRGNIFGDHMVLSIFSDLVSIGVPVIFYGLGLFVAFVQAFVFCLLTMVYIALSTSHDH